MKRITLSSISFLGFGLLLVVTSGCYTQLAVREHRIERHDYPDYTETYTDSSGTVVNNNYYDDGYDYPRSSTYFHYYYPTRMGFMWSAYYDPYWDWCGTGWFSHGPYYDPWYWGPSFGHYGGYYGGYGYPWYSHSYGYRGHGDRWAGTYSGSSGRSRTYGTTRSYGVTRSLVGSRDDGTMRATAPRTRTSDVYDRISTRSRDRASSPDIRNDNATRTRERTTYDRSRDNTTTRDRSVTPSTDSRSRERTSTAPPNDSRSRERSSSPPPSDSRSRERTYSPPPSSSPRGGDSGGSRSSGGNSGSSGGSSNSGSGRSRTR